MEYCSVYKLVRIDNKYPRSVLTLFNAILILLFQIVMLNRTEDLIGF